MEVIAEIERSIADLDNRLWALGRPSRETCTMAYSSDLGWFCSGNFKGVRGRNANPMTALSMAESMVRDLERENDALARTLGIAS